MLALLYCNGTGKFRHSEPIPDAFIYTSRCVDCPLLSGVSSRHGLPLPLLIIHGEERGYNMAKHWNVVVNYGSLSDDTFFTDNWLDVVAKIADLNNENLVELSSIQIFKIDDSILKLFDRFLSSPAQDENSDFSDYPLYCPAPPDEGDNLPDDYFEGWW